MKKKEETRNVVKEEEGVKEKEEKEKRRRPSLKVKVRTMEKNHPSGNCLDFISLFEVRSLIRVTSIKYPVLF